MFEQLTNILQNLPSNSSSSSIQSSLYKTLKDYLQQLLLNDSTEATLYEDLHNLTKKLRKDLQQLTSQVTLQSNLSVDTYITLKCTFEFLYFNISEYLKHNSENREKLGVMLQKEQVVELLVIPLLNHYKNSQIMSINSENENENTVESQNEIKLQNEQIHLVDKLLQICLIMPTPSKKELKTNKIGKIVNKLTKDSQNGNSIVQDKAQELVTKWKKDLKNRLEQEKAYQVHKSSQDSTVANNNIIDQTVNQDSAVKVSAQKQTSIPDLNGEQIKIQQQSHTEEKLESAQTLSQQLQLLSSFDIKPSTSSQQKHPLKQASEHEHKLRDSDRDKIRRSRDRDRERYRDKDREGDKFKERDNESYKQRERERHRDKERERERNRDRDRDRARNTKDRNKDKDTVQLQIQTKEEYSNSSNHKSSIQHSQTDKLPKKSNLVKVKQKKNTRKIVRFEKEDIKLRQLRYFSISDSPNAAFLNESEIIPLRELPNGASFKNINDMKRADMLREKKTMSGATSKKVMKANELSKMSNINSGSLNVELSSKLVNWSTQQLYCKYSYIYHNHYEIDVDLMEGYAKSNGDESDEIKNQRSREKGFIKPKYNYTYKLFIQCSFVLSFNTKQKLQTKSQQLN